MARPTDLTDDVSAILLSATEKGMPLAAAAELAGVAPSTVREWVRRGEDREDGRPGGEPFATFAAELGKARGRCMLDALGHIEEAAKKGKWSAAAWLLERRFPSEWALRVRAEVDGELAGALDRLQAGLPPEQYQRVIALISAEPAPGGRA